MSRESPSEVLLACGDDGLELISRNRQQLSVHGYRVGHSKDDVVLSMLDKHQTYALARQHGIECPATITIESEADVEEALATLPFPCAVKPLHSHLFARHFKDKLFVARDRASLLQCLRRTQALGLKVLVTEIIPGPDDSFASYYSYLDDEGNPLFHFTKRKIRGHPIHFGNWCYQVTAWDEEIAQLGLHFFQKIGLTGVGNVEFKRDARDGRPKLIECNHRFTASNEILRKAGVDVARLAYARAVGKTFEVRGFREGVHLWHPAEDVAALVAYRRVGELSLLPWITSLLHRQHVPIFRFQDPLPGVINWLRVPRRFTGWLRRSEAIASGTNMPPPGGRSPR
jgi:predicted ATP-grasp superfamily ATP-dependent carboligase